MIIYNLISTFKIFCLEILKLNSYYMHSFKNLIEKRKTKTLLNFCSGVPSYEVLWSDISGQYDALIPDDQFEGKY